MERVAFLIEKSGIRLSCLLNPDSLVVKRRAGIRERRVHGSKVSGFREGDDQLLMTGGGETTFILDLLFDVSLAGSSLATDDVRELTGKIWALAENSQRENGRYLMPQCRFLWGKSWNILAVVTAIAERLEYFDANGVPARSWLRMRLRRVQASAETHSTAVPPQNVEPLPTEIPEDGATASVHVLLGSGDPECSGERIEQVAGRYLGVPGLWRLIAAFNHIDNPQCLEEGQVLRIPEVPMAGGQP